MYIQDDTHASFRLLGVEFEKRGYTVTEETRNGRLFVTYTSPSGKVWSTRAALLRYPCVSEQARYISRHKEVAYQFAAAEGVSIPYTRHLSSDEILTTEEVHSLLTTYGMLIVKPSNTSLSRGLTLKIKTEKALMVAIAKARKVSPSVLIQEQVEGEEIRFVVMNGKVVSALLRQTPRVTGDGISMIAQLIQVENQVRQELVFEHITYPQLDETIIDKALLTSERVVAAGEVVELNRATMIKNGCSLYDVISNIHPSYLRSVESLVKNLDTKFIVVDMFIRDYTQPQTERNHWFIEFNTSPVLKLFYSCRDNKMFDIVPKLVSNIDSSLHRQEEARQVTIGSFESVTLPDYSESPLLAKIDTGAYSGAVYATYVRKKLDETGRPYLAFALNGDRSHTCRAYDFYQRKVRSAHGHVQVRYVIKTYIKIQEQLYETDIGLSDRANMKYPVLIGRKFLRDNNILVDVTMNEMMDHEKELLG